MKGKGTNSPADGKFIRVKIIDPGYFMGSIMCLVEDRKGQVVNLALHNFVPLSGRSVQTNSYLPNKQTDLCFLFLLVSVVIWRVSVFPVSPFF